MATVLGKNSEIESRKAPKHVYFLAEKAMVGSPDGIHPVPLTPKEAVRLPEAYAEKLVAAKRGKIVAAPNAPTGKAAKADAEKALKLAIVELMKQGKSDLEKLAVNEKFLTVDEAKAMGKEDLAMEIAKSRADAGEAAPDEEDRDDE